MTRPSRICHILAEDPNLTQALEPAIRQSAIDECIAPVAHLHRGRWYGHQLEALIRDGIGLLVLKGLLLRRVGVDGRYGAELLGVGDLLRPWQGEDTPQTLPLTTGWQVLEPARLAVLDRRVARRLARYPDLTGGLVGRALERSRNLAVNIAIVHQARVDVRLTMLLWHLADRWGRVTVEGVALPLGLNHTMLAELVAARRPTVSSALSELTTRGLLTRTAGGWLLYGEPPAELIELRDPPVPTD